MGFKLEFVDGFPEVVPDPPRAHAQFTVKWKCINSGDEKSPEAAVVAELADANGPLITSVGRNVMELLPGQTDEDTVGVGAVGPGSGTLTITIDGDEGEQAIIPITIV
jgi:hypothetical protein